jgi:hypothetical protein
LREAAACKALHRCRRWSASNTAMPSGPQTGRLQFKVG